LLDAERGITAPQHAMWPRSRGHPAGALSKPIADATGRDVELLTS
jgi:hypothetical protein